MNLLFKIVNYILSPIFPQLIQNFQKCVIFITYVCLSVSSDNNKEHTMNAFITRPIYPCSSGHCAEGRATAVPETLIPPSFLCTLTETLQRAAGSELLVSVAACIICIQCVLVKSVSPVFTYVVLSLLYFLLIPSGS